MLLNFSPSCKNQCSAHSRLHVTQAVYSQQLHHVQVIQVKNAGFKCAPEVRLQACDTQQPNTPRSDSLRSEKAIENSTVLY